MLGCRPFRPAGDRPIPSSTTAARKGKSKTAARAGITQTDPGKTKARRRSQEDKLAELRRRLLEISDLGGASSVLSWDQATYMPRGGATARARQCATLSRLVHEKFTDPEVGRLLDDLAPHAARLEPESDDACLLRVVRRDFDKATKVPAEFVARWSAFASASY